MSKKMNAKERRAWTARAARASPTRATASKYRAVPTVIDGIRFASKKEARRYTELKLLEKAGAILELQCQFPFELAVWTDGRDTFDPLRIGKYVADFTYHDMRTNDRVVEDVKGFKTPLYRWKKKHVEAQYGIRIVEI